MNVYEASVPQLKKMLENLERWLAASVEHAQARSFDPNVFVASRLAPNMFTLARQVRSACDGIATGTARLAGKEAPKLPEPEQTIDDLRARIRACVAYLDSLAEADFAGADTRAFALPILEGKTMSGSAYLTEMVLPNFYFHVTTAYAILRHNGVELGKRDFLGALSAR
jgi:hypothetical protein